MLEGGCHCGAVRFGIRPQEAFTALCHCLDCRRQSGAPAVAWAMVQATTLSVSGEPRAYASSKGGRRSFCGTCGTGLFFLNDALRAMGMVQVRVAALDDPDAMPPQAQVQTAERIGWFGGLHRIPAFERFPG